jgi:hypothetical protein
MVFVDGNNWYHGLKNAGFTGGDYTPAVEAAMSAGKNVFAAAIEPGAQLAKVVYKYLPLNRDWFADCFGE